MLKMVHCRRKQIEYNKILSNGWFYKYNCCRSN